MTKKRNSSKRDTSHLQKISFDVDPKILEAVNIESDKLSSLFLLEVIPNLQISVEVAEYIIRYLRSYFKSMIKTQLELRNLKSESEIPDKDLIGGLVGSGVVNANITSRLIGIPSETPSVSSKDFPDLIAYVNYMATFSIPRLLIRLAILDRRIALDKSKELSKELKSEIDDLLKFKEHIVQKTNPIEMIMMDILKARKKLIDKNKRIPLMHEIAAVVRPGKHKNTLNSELKSLGIKFSFKTGVFTDRKTNEVLKIQ